METPTTLPPKATSGLAPAFLAEIKQTFRQQQAHRAVLRATSAETRKAKLKDLRNAIFARRKDFHAALAADFGKPAEEVDLAELAPTLIEIKYARKHLAGWMKPRKVKTPLPLFGTKSEIRYEPKGVGLIISPWNYPINLTLAPLVGAVSAGCPVMLKPSEYTPSAARLLKEMLADLFPEKEVALFEGDAAVAQALLKLPFNHIYFTGSPAVGKLVMKAAAEHLASVTLELGGKSPVIVDESADVATAAKGIAFGKFSNAGQICIAPDHLYVHRSLHDRLIAALREEIHSAFGDGTHPSPDFARIVNERHHRRVQNLLERAVEAGAGVAAGGNTQPAAHYIAPTLLTDVPAKTEVMAEEIFGPLLPVLPFDTLDEVLDDVNSRPNPLALYIFSKKHKNIEKVLNGTTAGGTCINDTLLHFIHPELPFGGAGFSGIGRGNGHHGFLAFSNERGVLRQRLKHAPLQLFYPPYTPRTRKLIDLLLKYF